MQDEQQFEQLMMQYRQLKNRAMDISRLIDSEDYDSAITLIKTREEIFISCKCIRRYLELTPEQEQKMNTLLDEIKVIEQENMSKLEKSMNDVQAELLITQKSQKINNAYRNRDDNESGSMVNLKE